MLRGVADPNSRTFTLLLGGLALGLVVCMILLPDQVFQSSLRGLKLWWEYVFPALLPFMILSELLAGFGVISGLGVLLDPLMRSAFGVPGAGGWALAVGIVGGYPLGADAAAKLTAQGGLSHKEAERLIAASHLCSPMVMVAVIGSGFLHSAAAGFIIAAVHYAGALAAGLIVRAARGGAAPSSRPPAAVPGGREEGLLSRAIRRMQQARTEDGRAFGKLLGDAVSSSVQKLLLIGGVMIIFSVWIGMLTLQLPNSPLSGMLLRLLPGMLEAHLGAYAISQASALPLSWKAACIGFALGWSGLSAHAQTTGITRGSGARYSFFAVYRLLHGACAFALTLTLWRPLSRLLGEAQPSFARLAAPDGAAATAVLPRHGWMALSAWGSRLALLLGLVLAVMLACSRIVRVIRRR